MRERLKRKGRRSADREHRYPCVTQAQSLNRNTYDITAKGSQLIVVLNGIETVNVRDSKLSKGPLTLQYGGGVVKFRKVQIRLL